MSAQAIQTPRRFDLGAGGAWPAIVGLLLLAGPTMGTLSDQVWSKDYGAHGPLIIATGLWLLWRQLPSLKARATPGHPALTALFLAVSLGLYVFGRAYDFILLETAGLYGAFLSVLHTRFGLRAMLREWFPFFYLGLAIPPPNWMMLKLTAPLKEFVSFASTEALRAFDVPVAREGVTLFVAQYQLLVEDACSGMNSLVGLTALGLFYIYLMRGTSVLYAVVLTCFIIPIAVVANIMRIMILILLTYFYGDDVAQGFLHFTAGIFLFGSSLLMVFLVDSLLFRLFHKPGEGGMIARRDLLIGGACTVAAAAAYGLKPRRHVSFLGKAALGDVVPRSFAGWVSHDVTDLVAPKEEGSLASRLYSQTVGRIYQQSANGPQVMMLLAYGDTQSDSLQLHRPEICYPFFGFSISGNRPVHLPLGGGVTIPARQLVATAPGRTESIVYWSRLGNFMPIDSGEQRVDRFKTALSGYIADGLLARFSIAGGASEAAFAILDQFVPALVRATAAPRRNVLVGETLAKALGPQ